MRRLSLLKLSIVAVVVAVSPCLISACQCSGEHYFGKSARDVAKLREEVAGAIFEGTLAKVEVRWEALDAKDGEMVPASLRGPFDGRRMETPYVALTFQVLKAYKGTLGPEAQIRTGMGGGDCGAQYAPGITYLVYASKSPDGQLQVSMCSPGGWVGSKEIQPDLRYLRKEPSTRSDLEPLARSDQRQSAKIEEEQHPDVQEQQKLYASARGKICGKVVPEKMKGSVSGWVYFLSTLGYSPMDPPVAEAREDGSFCSGLLGPGKYYVYFQGRLDDQHQSATFFPSSRDQAGATPVELHAGETQPDLKLNALEGTTYSVRGIVHANEKPQTEEPGAITLVLVPLDGGPLTRYRWQTLRFDGVLSLANAEYFQMEDVMSGRYAVLAETYAGGWFSRRVDLTVKNHSKFIFLELIHKKSLHR